MSGRQVGPSERPSELLPMLCVQGSLTMVRKNGLLVVSSAAAVGGSEFSRALTSLPVC